MTKNATENRKERERRDGGEERGEMGVEGERRNGGRRDGGGRRGEWDMLIGENGDRGMCVRENSRTSMQGRSGRAQAAWRGVRIFLSDDILTFTQAPAKTDHRVAVF